MDCANYCLIRVWRLIRRRVASATPIPPRAARSSVEGSGTEAGLALKPALGAKADATLLDVEEPLVPSVLLSNASRLEPESSSGVEEPAPVDDQSDDGGNVARMRLSKRLTFNAGSRVARLSSAAMRFSISWPAAFEIDPDAIAA